MTPARADQEVIRGLMRFLEVSDSPLHGTLPDGACRLDGLTSPG